MGLKDQKAGRGGGGRSSIQILENSFFGGWCALIFETDFGTFILPI